MYPARCLEGFGLRQWLSRARSGARLPRVTNEAGSGRRLRFGRFELDCKTHELRKDGLKVRLQDQPFHVLALLLERPGEVVTREELRQRLWPADTFVDFERGLNNAVRRLRDALSDSAETPRFVDTLPRVGYRFIAPIAGAETAAPAVPPAEPRAPRAGASRVRLAAPAAALALAGALAGALATREGAIPVPLVRPLTYTGQDFGPAASPDGRLVAFVSERDGRRRIWLLQLATGVEEPLTTGPDDTEPRFSPDGGSLLFTRGEAGVESLWRISAVGSEPRRLLSPAIAGDFSPDGRRLGYSTYAHGERPLFTLGVAATDGSEPREIAVVAASWMSPPRFSPDGHRIGVTHGDGTATSTLLVDVASGEQQTLRPPGTGGALSVPVWSRGGRDLLFFQSGEAYDGQGGRLVRQRPGSEQAETLLHLMTVGPGLDLAGPGRLVLDTRSVRQNLLEQPLQPGVAATPRWLTRGSSQDRQPAYSPDGERVVFTSNRSGNPELWEMALASGRLRRLTDHPAEDIDPHLMRDGRLVWASNRTGAFEIWIASADGGEPRQLTHHGLDAASPVATPDGTWIFYTLARSEGQGLWRIRPDGSAARGQLESRPTPLVPGPFASPEISPDGRYVLFAELRPSRTLLRLMRLEDSRLLPFEIELRGKTRALRRLVGNVPGCARFTPDGRAIAFVDLDEDERSAIFLQEIGGRPSAGVRRRLHGSDPDRVTESFAFSPDGRSLILAQRETTLHLLMAEGLPGVQR